MPERRHRRLSALRSPVSRSRVRVRDGQQLLAGLDAVAVLDVPLDLELVRADHGEDRLGDPQARDGALLARGEVAGGDGVLGDGRDGRDVHAVVEVLLDGEVGDVLDLDGVEARRRRGAGRARGRGRTPAVQSVRRVAAAAAAAVAAAAAAAAGRRSGSGVRPRAADVLFGRAHGHGSLGASGRSDVAG